MPLKIEGTNRYYNRALVRHIICLYEFRQHVLEQVKMDSTLPSSPTCVIQPNRNTMWMVTGRQTQSRVWCWSIHEVSDVIQRAQSILVCLHGPKGR